MRVGAEMRRPEQGEKQQRRRHHPVEVAGDVDLAAADLDDALAGDLGEVGQARPDGDEHGDGVFVAGHALGIAAPGEEQEGARGHEGEVDPKRDLGGVAGHGASGSGRPPLGARAGCVAGQRAAGRAVPAGAPAPAPPVRAVGRGWGTAPCGVRTAAERFARRQARPGGVPGSRSRPMCNARSASPRRRANVRPTGTAMMCRRAILQ